jgi:iron(III) transport system substrate-binding protein
MTMQIFKNISPIGYINTSLVKPSDIPTADALIDPKLKGKIASYDPGVNGAGLVFGSVVYVTRGADFATKLYQGQEVAYTRDYQQIADWVAHGNYAVGLGVTPIYTAQYAGAVPMEMMQLSDIKTIVSGGFGIISLFNNAPHPNAARVYVNWIASKEGVTTYGTIDGSAPVRTDVQPTWMDPELVPKPDGDYFDVFDYTYVMQQRQSIAKFYAGLKGS